MARSALTSAALEFMVVLLLEEHHCMAEDFRRDDDPHAHDPTYRFYEQIRDGRASRKLVLDAAQGLIPFDSAILGRVFGVLLGNRTDREVLLHIFRTLKSLPLEVIRGFAGGRDTDPNLLDALGRIYLSEEGLLRTIILNRSTPDGTFAFVAQRCTPVIQNLIANNEERLLRTPAIIDALLSNPTVDSDVRMRVLIRQEERAEQVRRRTRTQEDPPSSDDVKMFVDEEEEEDEELLDEDDDDEELPSGPLGGLFQNLSRTAAAAPQVIPANQGYSIVERLGGKPVDEMSDAELAAVYARLQADEGDEEADTDLDFLGDDVDAFTEEGENADEGDLNTKLMKMTIAEKEVLALKGNGAVRSILIRDPARSVSMAVVNSPKVRAEEITRFAKLKSVSKDALRAIGTHREWSKYLEVNKNIAMNPLTPFDVAIGKLRLLTMNDLKNISKSREVSGAVKNQAKRLVDQKEKAQKKSGGH